MPSSESRCSCELVHLQYGGGGPVRHRFVRRLLQHPLGPEKCPVDGRCHRRHLSASGGGLFWHRYDSGAVSLPRPHPPDIGYRAVCAQPPAAVAGHLCPHGLSVLPAAAVAGPGHCGRSGRGRPDAVHRGDGPYRSAFDPAAAGGPGGALCVPIFHRCPVPVRQHPRPVLCV